MVSSFDTSIDSYTYHYNYQTSFIHRKRGDFPSTLCESTYRNFRCRASINSPQLDGPIYPQFYQLIKHLKQFFHNYYIPWRDFGLGYFVGTNFNIGNKFYICCDRPTILQSLFRIRDVFPPEVYLPHLVPSVYCVVNLMKLSLQNDNISILQFLLKILFGNFIKIYTLGRNGQGDTGAEKSVVGIVLRIPGSSPGTTKTETCRVVGHWGIGTLWRHRTVPHPLPSSYPNHVTHGP